MYLEDIRNINAQYTELTIQEWLVQTDMAKPVKEQSKTDMELYYYATNHKIRITCGRLVNWIHRLLISLNIN